MSEDDSVKHEGKWTRADLPSWVKIRDADDMAGNGLRSRVIDIALNEVVEHLNTHYPKPAPDLLSSAAECALGAEDRAKAAKRERDEWKARADQLRDERDDAVQSCMAVGRERDEWKALAEKAHADWEDIAEEFADFRVKVVAEAVKYRESHPPISHADIEKVVEAVFDREAGYDYGSDKPWPGTEPVASAVWDYLKDNAPAVYVVRESDTAPNRTVTRDEVAGKLRQALNVFSTSDAHLLLIADNVLTLFGVEAEQPVDPVEDQTDALADILYGDELVTDQMRGVLERVVRAGMLFPEQETASDD